MLVQFFSRDFSLEFNGRKKGCVWVHGLFYLRKRKCNGMQIGLRKKGNLTEVSLVQDSKYESCDACSETKISVVDSR